jgi:hypothetical protein
VASPILYISPYQVANVGITDRDLAWFIWRERATFFTSRWIGCLADRHGGVHGCRLAVAGPIMITTHFPRASLR